LALAASTRSPGAAGSLRHRYRRRLSMKWQWGAPPFTTSFSKRLTTPSTQPLDSNQRHAFIKIPIFKRRTPRGAFQESLFYGGAPAAREGGGSNFIRVLIAPRLRFAEVGERSRGTHSLSGRVPWTPPGGRGSIMSPISRSPAPHDRFQGKSRYHGRPTHRFQTASTIP